jgi:hypothetical protein
MSYQGNIEEVRISKKKRGKEREEREREIKRVGGREKILMRWGK